MVKRYLTIVSMLWVDNIQINNINIQIILHINKH
jgi:hypothetical protein